MRENHMQEISNALPSQVLPVKKSTYIIRLRKTIEKTGLSRSTIYNLINAGTFVPKIQISTRAIGFLESDVDAWIESRVAASRKGA
jgi:prophage regulatory protein